MIEEIKRVMAVVEGRPGCKTAGRVKAIARIVAEEVESLSCSEEEKLGCLDNLARRISELK
jgi:hypothetical protein